MSDVPLTETHPIAIGVEESSSDCVGHTDTPGLSFEVLPDFSMDASEITRGTFIGGVSGSSW